MAKFCISCGNQLPDEAMFCTKCGAKQPAASQPPAPEQNTYTPQPPAPAGAQTPAEKPKKSKKKWVVTGIGAGALVLAVVLFFVFILPLFKQSGSVDEIVFQTNGNTYYASPLLLKLNGDNPPELVTTTSDGSIFSPIAELSARDGKTLYYIDRLNYVDDGQDWLVKYKFSSANTISQEHWVDNATVTSSVFSKPDDTKPGLWLTALNHLCYDNGWVYFHLSPTMEYMLMQGDIMGKVGRISKDGKKIEQVGDINAYDMVVDNGWIYYADCGYNPSSEGKVSRIEDFSRAGIYKIKTNGTGKKLLHAFDMTQEQKESYNMGLFSFSGEMKIIDGKIWFLDYTSAGQGKLCRMDKNGNGFEYMSNIAALHYAIDGDSAYLYTSESSNDPSIWNSGYYAYNNLYNPVFYKVDLKTKAETALPFVKYVVSGMTCHDGYLYCSSFNFNAADRYAGVRLNLKTGVAQWLRYDQESSWGTDPETGRRVYNRGTPALSWETVETE